MSRASTSERGIALIVVIWVMTFLSITLATFAFSMRTEVDAALTFKEEAEAAALAEAGIARAMAEMVNAGSKGSGTLASFATFDSGRVALGRGAYRVSVTDEDGKISVNRASPAVLDRLFQNTGVRDGGLRQSIVDSIMDWRDADDLHHLHGAERDYYASLPHPYGPTNGDFGTLEELLLVKGMTREVFFGTVSSKDRLDTLLATAPQAREFQPGEYLGVQSFLTVRGSGRVNVNTASLDVLVAFGVPPSEATAILETRKAGEIRGQLPRGAQGLGLTTVSGTFTLHSVGSITGSAITYRTTAVVLNKGSGRRLRPTVVFWKEGS